MDKKTKGHIETLNREMGEVKTDMTWMKNEIKSMKSDIRDSKRLIVVGILVPIVLFLVKMIWGG